MEQTTIFTKLLLTSNTRMAAFKGVNPDVHWFVGSSADPRNGILHGFKARRIPRARGIITRVMWIIRKRKLRSRLRICSDFDDDFDNVEVARKIRKWTTLKHLCMIPSYP